MKPLAFFSILLAFLGLAACEKELKEHKIPPALKKELAKMKKKNSPEAQAKEISGVIDLDPERTLDRPLGASLFLVVKGENSEGGPPLAAKKYESFRLPLEFSIGPADSMIEGMPFEGTLTLKARLDQDGTAMPSPGDIAGELQVQPGQKDVKLVLNQLIEPNPDQQVAGSVTISAALQDKAPKGAVLFIIARKAGEGRGGPPLAVRRVQNPQFPYAFEIGQAHTMIPGAVFDGEVDISVRLDADGSAMPAPGDIEGRITARAGASNLQLVLNSVVEG